MWRMWEHIHGLHLNNLIGYVKILQVTSLCGWVARYIDNAVGGGVENCLYHIGVHAGAGRVGDDDIWTSMLCNEIICQDVFHIASIEQSVLDAVDFGVDLRILDGFGYILNANDLLGFLSYEVCDCACTSVKVVDQLATCKTSKLASHGI